MSYENDNKIELLREYLRMPTVHPTIDYEPCIKFLRRLAAELLLPINVFYPYKPDKPIVIITWIGSKPSLPSVMFNSHMDVATVYPTNWVYPPFSAHMDDNGTIYGRGVQNSKALAIQYIMAIQALKSEGFRGLRTAHITFMPDKETGGIEGMKAFVLTNFFRQMNVGFALDGGVASPIDECSIFYAERIKILPIFRISGATGDSSFSVKGTVGEKFNYILNKLMSFREREFRKFSKNKNKSLGDITSINLSMVNSGEEHLFLPETMEAHFDIRLSLKEKPELFVQQLRQWALEAGEGVEIEFPDFDLIKDTTPINKSNAFWMTFKQVCEEEDISIKPLVLPDDSDSRFLRQAGVPTLNFSPMPYTQNLAYDDNECLHSEIFLDGVEFYKKMMPALLNTEVKSDKKFG